MSTLNIFGDTGKMSMELARQRAGLGAIYNEAIHPVGEAVASVLKFRAASLFAAECGLYSFGVTKPRPLQHVTGNTMTWHTYEIAPIDFGWENLKTVRETASVLLGRSEASARKNDIDASDLQAFLRSWESAKSAASEKGWEGDLKYEPVVMWIPTDTEFSYGFVFKQDNNGTTFVISPVEMPWLD